jgi:PAS domain S-box-containing protein
MGARKATSVSGFAIACGELDYMAIEWDKAFEGIVNISADAIISIDENHRIIQFNKGAEEIFGWSAQEMVGGTLDPLIPARFRGGHPQEIRNFAASSIDARRMGERREISGLRRNGQEFAAEASISKINVGDQRVYTVVMRDVTERKAREEELQRLYEEAQRALAVRDDVLSFVSHDLGNPLAAIKVASAVLLKRVPPDDPIAKHVNGIRDAVEQAQRLIRDLLDIQKAEAGKLVLHPEKLDMNALLNECINTLRPMIEQKQLQIVRADKRDLPRVHADHDRITQVAMNLISNAVKFSAHGGRIHIEVDTADDAMVVSIRDEGTGIAAEELPYIFERYWQASKTGKVGHGVGLSIVQAMVKAHSGEVWAQSKLGSGSTFFFRLPLTTSAAGSDS